MVEGQRLPRRYQEPMRNDSQIEKTPLQRSIGLSRTASTSLIILGLVSFGSLLYCLFQAKPKEADALSFFLPYAIPFGCLTLISMFLGTLCITQSDRPWARKAACIGSMIVGTLYAGTCFVYAWPLGNLEMSISIAVIALCVIFIGWLSLAATKEETQE